MFAHCYATERCCAFFAAAAWRAAGYAAALLHAGAHRRVFIRSIQPQLPINEMALR